MADKKKTMFNVYQGKQPCESFDSESEANAYIANRKIECRRLGIDTKDKEHAFSTKTHTVTIEEGQV